MDDWSLQPFAGLTFQATDRLLLGAVYRAKSNINLSGDLNFRNWQLPIPKPSANSAKLQWDNPQLVEIRLGYWLNDEWYLMAHADWEDWSEFSDNYLSVEDGTLDPDVALDRDWKDTWHAGVAVSRQLGNRVYSMGLSYDSSPVSDGKRTIDLPMDSQLIELGNCESFVFDVGLGSGINYNTMQVPASRMTKIFLTHLHTDHTSDLAWIYGFGPAGDRYTPLEVFGPTGTKPEYGSISMESMPTTAWTQEVEQRMEQLPRRPGSHRQDPHPPG